MLRLWVVLLLMVLFRSAFCLYLRQQESNTFEDMVSDLNSVQDAQQPDKKELQDALSDIPQNGEIFEGDIVMDSRLKNAVLGISKKSALSDEEYKWKKGILYYEVEDNFTANNLLEKTIYELERRTCIRFQKRVDESDYVAYTSKQDMCSSYIGRQGGRQEIFIGAHCQIVGTVEHETMHALGFIHEQSRPERDNYVSVQWKNIQKEEWSNFFKFTFGMVNYENVEYNFASVMHYPNKAFTNNGLDTLVAIGEPDLKFGQRKQLSVGDVKGINTLYGCSEQLANPDYEGLIKDYSGKKQLKNKRKAKRKSWLFGKKN